MNRSLLRNILVLGVLALLALPASAAADWRQVIEDCSNEGRLSRDYSNAELRKAREKLPTELAEYSSCREIIGAAVTGGSDRGGGRESPGQGVGGAGAADPGEAAARSKDASDLQAITSSRGEAQEPPSVKVGDETVEPGANGLFDLASASNEMPVPLLIALVGVGLLGLGGACIALRKHMPALARIPLLNKIPAPRVPFTKRS